MVRCIREDTLETAMLLLSIILLLEAKRLSFSQLKVLISCYVIPQQGHTIRAG